jgi:hypothetical protein
MYTDTSCQSPSITNNKHNFFFLKHKFYSGRNDYEDAGTVLFGLWFVCCGKAGAKGGVSLNNVDECVVVEALEMLRLAHSVEVARNVIHACFPKIVKTTLISNF